MRDNANDASAAEHYLRPLRGQTAPSHLLQFSWSPTPCFYSHVICIEIALQETAYLMEISIKLKAHTKVWVHIQSNIFESNIFECLYVLMTVL